MRVLGTGSSVQHSLAVSQRVPVPGHDAEVPQSSFACGQGYLDFICCDWHWREKKRQLSPGTRVTLG